MAIDEKRTTNSKKLNKARRSGFGLGLLKGMAVTFKHLFKHNTVIQYPDEKQDLGPRTRGVIALKEENCTVCMLCSRECPDWCIYIESHKETLPPKREGGRPRKRNVLDRFAIDYALCMYCGICVEVCPYDALFWSREFEYAEYDIRELTHEKERLSDWMATVLPPPPLDEGAEIPGRPAKPAAATSTSGTATAGAVTAGGDTQTPVATTTAPPATKPAGATTPATTPTMAPEGATEVDADRLPPAPQGSTAEGDGGTPEAAGGTGPGSAQRPAPPAAETAAEERPEQSERVAEPAEASAPSAEAASDQQEEAGETAPEGSAAGATETKAPEGSSESGEATGEQKAETPAATASAEPVKEGGSPPPGPVAATPRPPAQDTTTAPASSDEAEAVYKQVLQEQLDKGSSPQVAEARARVARAKSERGIKRGPTPVEVEKPVPSAPTKGHAEPAPSGAPAAVDPVEKPQAETAGSSEAGGSTEAAPQATSDTPLGGRRAEEATPQAREKAAPEAEATHASEGEKPADVGEEKEGALIEPGPSPDTGETGPDKVIEKVADEPQTTPEEGSAGGDDLEAVFQRVYEEEKAKGSSEAVATGRAKAAQAKAKKAKGS